MNSMRRDIIVIGGSAGALDPLVRLLDSLPVGFTAPVFVTLHIPPDSPSFLPQLLSNRGHRIARHPVENEQPQPGVVYVAPPDAHLLVNRGALSLGHGARENRHRPAIDVMFRSAARAYGGRVAAIVLSGQLDDGAAGLIAVKAKRGLTIVQDPNEATVPELPCRAVQYAKPDHVLPIGEIAKLLGTVNREVLPRPHSIEVPASLEDEVEEAIPDRPAGKEPKGSPSAFACPECHGVLWELEEGQLLRFRCRVGHAYTADALRIALSEGAEDALWAARRVLEERAALLIRLAEKSRSRMAANYREEAAAFDRHAETIGKMLLESQQLINEYEGREDAA